MQLPLLHTRPLPQLTPLAQSLSAQSTWPSQSSSRPLLQFSASHAAQLPPLQTWPDPQLVPSPTFPDSMHFSAPVVQETVPVLHVFVGVQGPPWLHEWQLPSRQYIWLPHILPLLALPLSWHCDVPVSQEVLPTRQGFPGAQEAPGVHALQVPLLQ